MKLFFLKNDGFMKIKQLIRKSLLWPPILAMRAVRFERAYRNRRDRYARILQERSWKYDEEGVIASIRKQLQLRGYKPSPKKTGELRTFSIIGEFTWHPALIRELREIGEVYNCDYEKFALDRAPENKIVSRRKDFSDFVYNEFKREHKQKPFDWIFAYVNGKHILAETIERIHEEFGIPTVNMCLDDKNGWVTYQAGEQNCGQVDIAGVFDLSWTSASVACDWYLAEGGRPIFMPEGCNPSEYYPRTDHYDIPISFLGASYGCRPIVIRYLRRHGVPLKTFGYGWGKTGEFAESPVEIFSRSQVNFGIGGIAFSESLTNVKGRDFDIPCTGGGVYLTTYNPDLAKAFDIGREVLCYRNRDEAVEMSMYYLARPEECREVALRARERCLREHRWSNRFIRLLNILEIVTK